MSSDAPSDRLVARYERVAAARAAAGVGGRARSLVEASVKPETMRRYKSAVRHFLDWCDALRVTFATVEECDDLLADYFQWLWDSGQPKYAASNALYGINKLWWQTNRQLYGAALCLRGWNKLEPSVAYPPLIWELAVAVAFRLAARGWPDLAVAVVVGHDCLLRNSEILSLTTRSLADPGGAAGAELRGLGVWLRHTKTGPNQSVTVERPEVATLLSRLRDRRVSEQRSSGRAEPADGTSLFQCTVESFRRRFKLACADLHLSSAYVVHSLRHGGATRLYMMGVSVDAIMLRGRWAALESARRYIQATRALAIAAAHLVPPATLAAGRLLATDVTAALSLAAGRSL
jgi:hypothetical protein